VVVRDEGKHHDDETECEIAPAGLPGCPGDGIENRRYQCRLRFMTCRWIIAAATFEKLEANFSEAMPDE
jgi:hypothetical protein